jgi:hypothetical protein
MVDGINQAQAERTAAQAEIDSAPSDAVALDLAEVYAMIDSLGDVGAVIGEAKRHARRLRGPAPVTHWTRGAHVRRRAGWPVQTRTVCT